jgi:hypothetical protein
LPKAVACFAMTRSNLKHANFGRVQLTPRAFQFEGIAGKFAAEIMWWILVDDCIEARKASTISTRNFWNQIRPLAVNIPSGKAPLQAGAQRSRILSKLFRYHHVQRAAIPVASITRAPMGIVIFFSENPIPVRFLIWWGVTDDDSPRLHAPHLSREEIQLILESELSAGAGTAAATFEHFDNLRTDMPKKM